MRLWDRGRRTLVKGLDDVFAGAGRGKGSSVSSDWLRPESTAEVWLAWVKVRPAPLKSETHAFNMRCGYQQQKTNLIPMIEFAT